MEKILKLAAPVFAALVFLTNMITEAIKKIKEDVNAKLVALITAIVLSIITCEVAVVYLQFAVWYYFSGAAVVGILCGFIVAQVAETGYDGAYMEFIDILKTIIKAVLGAKEKTEDDEECDEDVKPQKRATNK